MTQAKVLPFPSPRCNDRGSAPVSYGLDRLINSFFSGTTKLETRSRASLKSWMEFSEADCGIDFVITELEAALERARAAKDESA